MNEYQKRLHKEVKELSNVRKLSYKRAKKTINTIKKYEIYTPCEDCDYCYCTKKKNKLAYCRDRL